MPVVASIPQQISPGQVALKCICRIALPPFLLLLSSDEHSSKADQKQINIHQKHSRNPAKAARKTRTRTTFSEPTQRGIHYQIVQAPE